MTRKEFLEFLEGSEKIDGLEICIGKTRIRSGFHGRLPYEIDEDDNNLFQFGNPYTAIPIRPENVERLDTFREYPTWHPSGPWNVLQIFLKGEEETC